MKTVIIERGRYYNLRQIRKKIKNDKKKQSAYTEYVLKRKYVPYLDAVSIFLLSGYFVELRNKTEKKDRKTLSYV